MFLPELELARAWERASAGDTATAQTHAVQAAQIAEAARMHAVELRARHAAVRFGDRSQARRLERLARILSTALAEAVADHARGLAQYDGGLLDSAAQQFADLGALTLAADASAQAAGEYARRGERGEKFESSTWAHALASQCGSRTPAVVATASPLPFSGRERQIVMLVAAGLSNREIANRLVISVRTVEGHLYRIFAKLGINTRDQLVYLTRRAVHATGVVGPWRRVAGLRESRSPSDWLSFRRRLLRFYALPLYLRAHTTRLGCCCRRCLL
ncbi:hypothetical protein MTIM_52930 [Mycobacterium timonense]|uniref:HTH luxR-type domain-containing protein n=1 Tax=Mycobacterium timonense TaxID=701043 RepID=A0A7I9ZEI0_9MYCO|nr:hypothetical protein MTIM_52930 [Mycobacterium timonense]